MLLVSAVVQGCIQNDIPEHDNIERTIIISCSGSATKELVSEEDRIKDLNLIVMEEETAEYLFWKEDITAPSDLEFRISFVKGKRYSLFAIANLGRKTGIMSLEDLKDFRIEADSPISNIPMSAFLEDIDVESHNDITVELVRMTAKISIRIDRSGLSEDVEMTVQSLGIRNCPKSVGVIGPSRASSPDDIRLCGHELDSVRCAPLNTTDSRGFSEEVSLYMFENMQGKFPYPITEDEEKVIDNNDPLSEICSFIEIEFEYKSDKLISYDSNLIYRFYLGENLTDLNIERNCHYHITVRPEDDGLSGCGWRVDKSGIGPIEPFFNLLPEEIVEGHVGDTLRVWCECYPRTAPFDPGYEELEFDKERGIYDYEVDEDGHGVTLYLKGTGTGLIYMSAGEPINRSDMVIVVVNP